MDLLLHLAHVVHGLHDISCAWLAFRADHRGAFLDTAECFSQVLGAADKGHRELRLIDVVDVISRREHFGLVDVVDIDGLKDLCFRDMPDPAFCHDRDAYGLLDAFDHRRVAHAGDASCSPDVCRYPLQRHDCARPCILGDSGLLGRRDVHDDTTLEHLRKLAVDLCALRSCFLALCSHRPSFLLPSMHAGEDRG